MSEWLTEWHSKMHFIYFHHERTHSQLILCDIYCEVKWSARNFCSSKKEVRSSYRRGRLLLWPFRGKSFLCAHNPQTRHRQGTGCTAPTQTFISFNNQQYSAKNINSTFFVFAQIESRSCFSLTKKTGGEMYLHLTTSAARVWNAAIILVVLGRKIFLIFGPKTLFLFITPDDICAFEWHLQWQITVGLFSQRIFIK